MPRLPTSLLRKAYTIDRLLPPLLGICRELQSAQNELRWLREHVEKFEGARRNGRVRVVEKKQMHYGSMSSGAGKEMWRTVVRQRARKRGYGDEVRIVRSADGKRLAKRKLAPRRDRTAHIGKGSRDQCTKGGSLENAKLLTSLVRKRAKGWPLQYGLGTEYFGALEIECRPGVLIPRPETAASVSHLARSIREAKDLPTELRVLDLCTGTGCIPLLFQDEFYALHSHVELRALGVDISRKAIALANRNLQRVRRDEHHVYRGVIEFVVADVLVKSFHDQTRNIYDVLPLKNALSSFRKPMFWDMLISNPPYISPVAFRTTTARSVRGFEPRLALVPPQEAGRNDTEQGDAFYPMLLVAARDSEAKIVLLEVADMDQALRVARMAQAMQIFDGIEIWRDQPDESVSEELQGFPVIGQGNGRSVLCWRGRGAVWLGKRNDTEIAFKRPDDPKNPLLKSDDPHHHRP